MIELWIAIAALMGAYACFVTMRLLDMRRERDEAIDKYNSAYALGYSAGVQEAGAIYKSRIPWQDGYSTGYRAGERAAQAQAGAAGLLERTIGGN